MQVIKKTQHGTRYAVISEEAMAAIVAYEAHEAELAQRAAAPSASTKASGARAKPVDAPQELFHAKAED